MSPEILAADGGILHSFGFLLAVKIAAVLLVFLTVPLAVGMLEHKGMAHMQARLGPMYAGGFHGWAQLVADGIKFVQKEDVVPDNADRSVFKLAPAVSLLPAMFVLVVIPVGPDIVAEPLDIGLFYALAISSVSVIGMLMAAWSSANKFSLLGGIRGAAQLIAYELPLILSAVSVVILSGTLSLTGIAEAWRWWWLLALAPGIFIFFTSSLAELNRPPFDMPIADSEIIAGHMTEYTGLRYAFFMLTEYAGMVVLAALATVLFLGGWYIWPGIAYPAGWPVWLTAIVAAGVSVGKIMTLVFVMVWLRATFPRLREDQLQRMSWLVMIPLGLFNIVIVAIAKVVA
ncbi:MAG TPA: complex I subunit 1 family protein [Frankiaceae bacterium]|nr:complex I subunit 1 family protein [Frankiaceae bacterium]